MEIFSDFKKKKHCRTKTVTATPLSAYASTGCCVQTLWEAGVPMNRGTQRQKQIIWGKSTGFLLIN